AMTGTFTGIGGNTNKILWQHKTPYRVGQGGGSTTTAGGLVFRGEPDGNVLAIDAKTGQELWRFQTGFGADAPPAVYEVNGEEYVAIAAGGNQGMLSANGDPVWVFSLKGQLGPLWPPPPPHNRWRDPPARSEMTSTRSRSAPTIWNISFSLVAPRSRPARR